MKTAKMIGMIVAGLSGCLTLGVFADGPVISDVKVRQRWPWSRLVDIEYVLSSHPTQRMDIAVSAFNGSEPLPLPLGSLSFSGDMCGVSQGIRHMVWDPTKTAYTNETLKQFRVELTPTNIPLYMIVSLTNVVGTSPQIEYIYPGDPNLVTVGPWTNVWFDVTNHTEYKTDKLVLRRVSAGTFKMGGYPPTVDTTLTQDFYIGVFNVTEAQWVKVMGGSSTLSEKPKNNTSYNTIRGITNDVPPINWPSTGFDVSPGSFLGKLRANTGFDDFDLPTEAQWEYACRAGTQSYYNDGVSTSDRDNNTNILNEIAWWLYNRPDGIAVHPVGQKAANHWGLYDTLGNLWEWCRDWSTNSLPGGTDPAGPVWGTDRELRGASYGCAASTLSMLQRYNKPPTETGDRSIRVVRVLP